jgi:adenosylmethionine-8-amino-7-oxononanoate aminotransferase
MHSNETARNAAAHSNPRGEGAWLYDFDGKRYLDAIGSWWVNLFGHATPRINSAVRDQTLRVLDSC